MAVVNKISRYNQGYVQSVGPVGYDIAGIANLISVGSTDVTCLCYDASGNIYATDAVEHIVIKIDQKGQVHTIAGLAGTSGNNGINIVTCANARFKHPTGITIDKNGDIYICDSGNHQIRRISNNKVMLVAGNASGLWGTADGVGPDARFNYPLDITVDGSGTLYVADTFNHAIRKIKGSVVTTIAGHKGVSGSIPLWADMTTEYGITGTSAYFDTPQAIAVDPHGYVYVADTNNHVIKRIDEAGNVRIFTGTGAYGTIRGTRKTSTYRYITALDCDKKGNLYGVDYSDLGTTYIVKWNEDGTPANLINFSLVTNGDCVCSVIYYMSDHIVLALSGYPNITYNSSSSSSKDSSSSTSSVSSSSSSSNSSSSVSSSSSSSLSSVSSSSSSSNSSSSSSSSYILNWTSSSSSSSSSSNSSSSNSSSSSSSNSSSSNSSSSSSSLSSSSSSSSSNSSSSNSSSSNSSSSSSLIGVLYLSRSITPYADGQYEDFGRYGGQTLYRNSHRGTFIWWSGSVWVVNATVGTATGARFENATLTGTYTGMSGADPNHAVLVENM